MKTYMRYRYENDILGTRNMAPYHISGDYASNVNYVRVESLRARLADETAGLKVTSHDLQLTEVVLDYNINLPSS
jgi:hypothetical protein